MVYSLKHIYWVRHCKAKGQPPEAPLTEEGKQQAEDLVDFLCNRGIDRIVSSPYVRARDSVVPLAERLGIEIEIDDRNLCYPEGESSDEATNRAIAAMSYLVSADAS